MLLDFWINKSSCNLLVCCPCRRLCLSSLSDKTSYRKISLSLEAARFGFKLFQSLWNLAGTSAALLLRCLSNFRAIRPVQHPISRLRDFTRYGGIHKGLTSFSRVSPPIRMHDQTTLTRSYVPSSDASGSWLPVVLNRWYDKTKKKAMSWLFATGVPLLAHR